MATPEPIRVAAVGDLHATTEATGRYPAQPPASTAGGHRPGAHHPGSAGRVAGVKGFGGGFPGRLVHEFGEPELKAFAAAGRRSAEALATALAGLEADLRIVLTHYAPVPDTLTGEPRELYPVLGNYQLGRAIDRAGVVALAVHGHAHHGSEHGTTPGGTPVRNVAQHVLGAPTGSTP